MALAAVRWAHRSVNLADCTKGDPVCEDVTDCGAELVSSDCCPFPIPSTLQATMVVVTGDVWGLTGKTIAIRFAPWPLFSLSGFFSGGAPPAPGDPTSQPLDSAWIVPIPGSSFFVGVIWLCSGPSPGVRVTIWENLGGAYSLVHTLFSGSPAGCLIGTFSCSPVFCDAAPAFSPDEVVITE